MPIERNRMSKYYALKVEEEIIFIMPWSRKEEPTLSDFQFAIARVWGKLGTDFKNKAISDYNVSGIERVSVIRSSIYPDTSKEEDMSESVEFITADPSTELCRIDSDGAVFVNGEPATDAEFMVALREFQREQKDDLDHSAVRLNTLP